MGKTAFGFTLIELLVVIAIMAITGVFTLANYSSFGEDQNLKSAVLDIQSLLRQAQANATSNAKCNNQFGSTWQVEFANATTVNLRCSASAGVIKSLPLADKNTSIQSISGTGTGCPTSTGFTIGFAPISGRVALVDPECTLLTISVQNDRGTTKSLKVDTGGRVYE